MENCLVLFAFMIRFVYRFTVNGVYSRCSNMAYIDVVYITIAAYIILIVLL